MKFAALFALLVLPLCALAQDQKSDQKKMEWKEPPPMTIDAAKKYTATLDTSKGKIVVELFAKEAPKTVNSFVFLAKQGFYDGTEFHRVIPGFMIQGGDRNGQPKGEGGCGYEFENENRDTARKYTEGTLGMANAGLNTNGSQFFIMDHDYPLDPSKYTIWGKLTEGQDVVHAIATAARDPRDKPTEAIILKSVKINEE